LTQNIEEGRFADIGQADKACFQIRAWPSKHYWWEGFTWRCCSLLPAQEDKDEKQPMT